MWECRCQYWVWAPVALHTSFTPTVIEVISYWFQSSGICYSIIKCKKRDFNSCVERVERTKSNPATPQIYGLAWHDCICMWFKTQLKRLRAEQTKVSSIYSLLENYALHLCPCVYSRTVNTQDCLSIPLDLCPCVYSRIVNTQASLSYTPLSFVHVYIDVPWTHRLACLYPFTVSSHGINLSRYALTFET